MEFLASIDLTQVSAIFGAFVVFCSTVIKAASVFVKYTPSEKDDAFIDKAMKFIEMFSVFSIKK